MRSPSAPSTSRQCTIKRPSDIHLACPLVEGTICYEGRDRGQFTVDDGIADIPGRASPAVVAFALSLPRVEVVLYDDIVIAPITAPRDIVTDARDRSSVLEVIYLRGVVTADDIAAALTTVDTNRVRPSWTPTTGGE